MGADIIENDCLEHRGWRGDVECPYCLQSKLNRGRKLLDEWEQAVNAGVPISILEGIQQLREALSDE